MVVLTVFSLAMVSDFWSPILVTQHSHLTHHLFTLITFISFHLCVKIYYRLLNFVLIIMFSVLLMRIAFTYLIYILAHFFIKDNVGMAFTKYQPSHHVCMLFLPPMALRLSGIVDMGILPLKSCPTCVPTTCYLPILNFNHPFVIDVL